MGFVYLIQQHKEVLHDPNVLKIGRTDNIHRRIKEHNKPRVITVYEVANEKLVETKIINVFNRKFKKRPDIGIEYFEGDIDEMKLEFSNIVLGFSNTPLGYGRIVEKNGKVMHILVDWMPEYKQLISNWQGNRTHSDERVSDLYAAYLDDEYIPKILHLAYKTFKGVKKLICIDGNHRRHMLDHILEKNPSAEIPVHVIIIDSDNTKEILKIFDNLNKALSVPSIFTEETAIDVKQVETFVETWSKKYKNFFMKSNSPTRPNTNITMFTDFVTNLMRHLNISEISELERILVEKNKELQRRAVAEKTKKNWYEKCDQGNFFLFYFSREWEE